MTGSLFETIQGIVREELGRLRIAELGVVEDLHPHASDSDEDNYSCSVRLRNSGLVLKRVPVATHRIGSVSIPEAGELVLVQFVGGDVNAPIVTGRLYNDEDRPPANDSGQAVLHLPLGADDGDAVHVELHSGQKRELVVRLGDGLTLTLKDDDPVVSVDVDGGKGAFTIDRDGAVGIASGGKVTIEGSEIEVKSSGTLTLKGAKVDIN